MRQLSAPTKSTTHLFLYSGKSLKNFNKFRLNASRKYAGDGGIGTTASHRDMPHLSQGELRVAFSEKSQWRVVIGIPGLITPEGASGNT
jgi:hypothetical protein